MHFLVTFFSLQPRFLKLRISKDVITRDNLCDFCNWKFKDAPVTLYIFKIDYCANCILNSLLTTTVRIFWGALLYLAMSALGNIRKKLFSFGQKRDVRVTKIQDLNYKEMDPKFIKIELNFDPVKKFKILNFQKAKAEATYPVFKKKKRYFRQN